MAREPHRYSGRTAMDANVTVHEPKPPDDPDSRARASRWKVPGTAAVAADPAFLGAGLELGAGHQPYQSEVGGPLRGGDPGRRLIEPAAGTPPPYFDRIPPPFEPQRRRVAVCAAAPHLRVGGIERARAGDRRRMTPRHTSRSTETISGAQASRTARR